MRPSTSVALLAFITLAALSACISATSGAFAPDGFHPATYPYVVHYTNPSGREILDANWRIDNFVLSPSGAPGEPKNGERYLGVSLFDLRGNGDPVEFQHYVFDLKLDNRRTSAVIWLQTVPLTRDREDRNLSTIVDEYADALSGTGFYATVEDDGKEVRAKTYAAKVVDGKASKVGDLDSYDARIELANVDQLRLDPNKRTGIIRIVLIRTNYRTTWGWTGSYSTRGLVRVGYYASPADFDSGLPDFERFLRLLEFKHLQTVPTGAP